MDSTTTDKAELPGTTPRSFEGFGFFVAESEISYIVNCMYTDPSFGNQQNAFILKCFDTVLVGKLVY